MAQFPSPFPETQTAGGTPPPDMPDSGLGVYSSHINISALPTLNGLPHNGRGGVAPTLWDGRTINLPQQEALPKMGVQPAPPVNQ